MTIPIVDLKAQYQTIKDEADAAIRHVLQEGQFILGPDVQRFEEDIAGYCGTKFAVGVASNVDNRIRGANITFECRFANNLGKFEIDTGLLRSTLINILENAMEACIEDPSNKEFRINFGAGRVGNDIQFDITDNGGGMTTNNMKNMFTMFYSTKGNRGTGLGLFIANQAIHKHGGNITVDSKPGEGTAFHIRLPRQYTGVSVE